MPELTDLLERADRAVQEGVPLPTAGFEGLALRDRRRRNQRIRAGVLGAAVALAVALVGARALLTEPPPVDTPTPPIPSPSVELSEPLPEPLVELEPGYHIVDVGTGEATRLPASIRAIEGAGHFDVPGRIDDPLR